MKYFLLLFALFYNAVQAQQKESTVSVSCYVNPELYIQAGVIAQMSDKAGKVSCSGKYLSLINKSQNVFYYKRGTSWISLKPQSRTVIMSTGENNMPVSSSSSIFRLKVKYIPDVSGSVATKIRTISVMNVQTDQIKKGQAPKQTSKITASNASKKTEITKPSNVIAANKPDNQEKSVQKNIPKPEAKNPPARNNSSPEKRQAIAKPKTAPAKKKPVSGTDKERVLAVAGPDVKPAQKKQVSETRTSRFKNSRIGSSTALGLRVDLGSGSTGIGPNIKHSFNKNISLDAALVFFEEDVVGLGAQIEQNFLIKTAVGLSWYLGIGPQFLFYNEDDMAVALVPVGGLEYNIPNSALNLSLDWRPNFYVSPATDVEAGRFGLSLRFIL